VAGNQLAFGPASVELFGVIVPVFPAVAGMLSVYLARLIAPNKTKQFTLPQKAALVGLLMLIELAAIQQFVLNTAKATLVGMTLGWMGMLVPEKGASAVWDWLKGELLVALGGVRKVDPPQKYISKSKMTDAEKLQQAKKIFSKLWPEEEPPDDMQEIVDRLSEL
jgi:hypothetical protein